MSILTLISDRFSSRLIKATALTAISFTGAVVPVFAGAVFSGDNLLNNGSGNDVTSYIGFTGTGAGTLSDGTVQEREYYINLGYVRAVTGTVNVSGVGSLWNLRGTVYANTIGYEGAGIVNLSNYGQMTANAFSIGYSSGSSGVINISDYASLTSNTSLNVGRNGEGTINIRNYGRLTANNLFSALGTTGTANINVESNGEISTAYLGLGTGSSRGNVALQILSGGKVNVISAGVSSGMGAYEGVNTVTALVSGAGSQLTGAGTLQIDSNSTLTVADGGKVEFDQNITTMASSTTVTATKIMVTGADSLLSAKSTIQTSIRNNASTTELIAANGGKIRSANDITISNTTMKIGNGVDTAPGYIDASTISNGFTRPSTVEFNHNAENYAFNNDAGAGVALAGQLMVKILAGGTVFNGSHSYTGTTTISGGKLVVNSSIAASSRTTVQTGGTLSGSGSVGALTLAKGGILSPGNSPGTFIAGSTTWQGGGTYMWEINNATGIAGTNWDLLAINGDLTFTDPQDTFYIDLQTLTSSNTAGALTNFDATQNYNWLLLSYTGNISNFDASRFAFLTEDFINSIDGGAFSVSQQGKNLYVNYTSSIVPEPSVSLLILAGIGSAILRRRRPRKA